MARITRRAAMMTVAAGALAAPRVARAQAADTLVFAPVSDLTGTDPLFSATDVTTHHVGLVFETLFGMDATLTPRPQLLEGASVEDDGRRWRLAIRPQARFHDGEPVRAEDAVASVRAWGKLDVFGRKLLAVTDALDAVSDRELVFRLKKPFPLLAHALAKPASLHPVIMPKRVAEIAGSGKPIEVIGSGPYRYLADERVSGVRVAYARNDRYVPRPEPVSYMAGGRVGNFQRVVWQVIPDASTAAASLQKGEIDWMHDLPPDLAPMLRREKDVTVQVQDFIGGEIFMRFNCLLPPFDNPAVRRAVLAGIDQTSFMQAAIGDDRSLWRVPVGVWSLGKPMSTDAGLEAMAGDAARAKRLLAEAGYGGETVVVVQTVDYPMLSAAALVAADLLKRMGMKVDLVPLSYAVANQRRNNKGAGPGAWNVFFGPFNGYNRYDPAAHLGISSAFSGWPKIDEIEALREKWFDAPDLAGRQAIAREIQLLVWRDVPYIPLGNFSPLTAYRAGLTGVQRGGAIFFGVKRG